MLTRYYGSAGGHAAFVADVFERAAPSYDRACTVMSLGSGRRYRRQALQRAGLGPGARLLDLGTGTGLVARAALEVVGGSGHVVGLDPSRAMLGQARRTLAAPLVEGRAEALPFAEATFDLVSMGYALRHVADLGLVFRECRRVLRPGGTLVILEVTRPDSAAGRLLMRAYLQALLPLVMRVAPRGAEIGLMTRYYWETIDRCVPPGVILDLLRRSGFAEVARHVRAGWFSEYVGVTPRRRGSADREVPGVDVAHAVAAQEPEEPPAVP